MPMSSGPPPNITKPYNKQYTEEALSEARLIKGSFVLKYLSTCDLKSRINYSLHFGKTNVKDMHRFQAAVECLYLSVQMKPDIKQQENFISFGEKVDRGETIPHLELCKMFRAIADYGQKIGIFKFEFVKSVNAGWDFNEDEITAEL